MACENCKNKQDLSEETKAIRGASEMAQRYNLLCGAVVALVIGFAVMAGCVVIPTAAGTVTISAFQDGVAIPGATASATVAAAATSVTLPISFGVRLNSGVTSSNITYILTGAAGSVTNAAQTVSKE